MNELFQHVMNCKNLDAPERYGLDLAKLAKISNIHLYLKHDRVALITRVGRFLLKLPKKKNAKEMFKISEKTYVFSGCLSLQVYIFFLSLRAKKELNKKKKEK